MACSLDSKVAPILICVLHVVWPHQADSVLYRACAEKMEIGVNYVPETPNLDRVVEMSALTDALQKAFPDLTPDQYPWPNTQDGGVGGVSKGVVRGAWPAPPKTRTSASSAQQALDRIRQAALPSRPVSASRVRHDSSEQQVWVTGYAKGWGKGYGSCNGYFEAHVIILQLLPLQSLWASLHHVM